MEPHPPPSFSVSFFEDLRFLRERARAPLASLHAHIRVQVVVLEQFESGELAQSGIYTPVYQRSILRGYASVLGIDASALLSAYEKAALGQYTSGELLEAYGYSISEKESAPATAPAAPTTGTPQSEKAAGASKVSTAKNKKFTHRTLNTPRRVVHIDSSRVDPSPVKLAQPAVKAGAQTSTLIVGPGMLRVLAIGIPFLVVIVVAAIVIWPRLSTPETTLDEITATRIIPLETEPPVPDSTEQALIPAAPDTTSSNPTDPSGEAGVEPSTSARATAARATTPALPSELPDTLRLIVRAVTDKVDPIRVKTDLDIRRPYWIDQGRTMTFPFLETIRIERHIDRISFEVLGRPISASIGDTTAVITREMIIQQLL